MTTYTWIHNGSTAIDNLANWTIVGPNGQSIAPTSLPGVSDTVTGNYTEHTSAIKTECRRYRFREPPGDEWEEGEDLECHVDGLGVVASSRRPDHRHGRWSPPARWTAH